MLGEVAFSSAFTQMQFSWEICCLNSHVCSLWPWSSHPALMLDGGVFLSLSEKTGQIRPRLSTQHALS